MSTYEIGLWIYQNGGGDVIQNSIIAQLQERDISAITELNLRNATATNGAIYCDGIRMEELDLFFSYNAGQQTQYQLYLYEALDR